MLARRVLKNPLVVEPRKPVTAGDIDRVKHYEDVAERMGGGIRSERRNPLRHRVEKGAADDRGTLPSQKRRNKRSEY